MGTEVGTEVSGADGVTRERLREEKNLHLWSRKGKIPPWEILVKGPQSHCPRESFRTVCTQERDSGRESGGMGVLGLFLERLSWGPWRRL